MTPAMNLAVTTEQPVSRSIDTSFIRNLFSDKHLPSPLLLLSKSSVDENYKSLKRALPRAAIHYAVKSNNHSAILDRVQACGGNFDVCSAAEIDAVLRTGVDAGSLIHSHPIKSNEEFDSAIEKGVQVFVVDNESEIEKLHRYTDISLKIMIRFRIATNHQAVVNLQYKFGCTTDEVIPLAQKIRESGHQYYGLCFHIGSQCIFVDNYIKAIDKSSELIESLRQHDLETSMLDIGGGFPVEYVEPIPSIEEFCQPIERALNEKIDNSIEVVCEPGRYISASPITLVSSIIGKSVRDGKVWYYLDDGVYSTFSGIVFDSCQYPVISYAGGEDKLSVLAGPTCDSFDVMYDGLMMPDHNIGDRIIFPLMGAYCAVSGSYFNSLKRPNYKVID